MQPVKDESRDALWASAALMGTIQFATFEARTPEEAWPLKSCDTTDLDWLKMSDGKKAVFAIADPTRADSVFCKMSTGHGKLWRPLIEPEDCSNTDAVEMTRDFVDMFGLGPSSTCGDKNPYYKAAMALARLLHVKCDRNNVVRILRLHRQHQPGVEALAGPKRRQSASARGALVCQAVSSPVVASSARDGRRSGHLHVSRQASWQRCETPALAAVAES